MSSMRCIYKVLFTRVHPGAEKVNAWGKCSPRCSPFGNCQQSYSSLIWTRARAWEWDKEPLFARGGQGSRKICVYLWNLWDNVKKNRNPLAISDISLIFAACKVLNIRIMRTFNYNEMPHEVLEMASEYAIKESRSGRGLSHSQAMEKIKEQRGWRNH